MRVNIIGYYLGIELFYIYVVKCLLGVYCLLGIELGVV